MTPRPPAPVPRPPALQPQGGSGASAPSARLAVRVSGCLRRLLAPSPARRPRPSSRTRVPVSSACSPPPSRVPHPLLSSSPSFLCALSFFACAPAPAPAFSHPLGFLLPFLCLAESQNLVPTPAWPRETPSPRGARVPPPAFPRDDSGLRGRPGSRVQRSDRCRGGMGGAGRRDGFSRRDSGRPARGRRVEWRPQRREGGQRPFLNLINLRGRGETKARLGAPTSSASARSRRPGRQVTGTRAPLGAEARVPPLLRLREPSPASPKPGPPGPPLPPLESWPIKAAGRRGEALGEAGPPGGRGTAGEEAQASGGLVGPRWKDPDKKQSETWRHKDTEK